MTLNGAFIVPHPPIIIPQIGKSRRKFIEATIDAYDEVARRIAVIRPDTIVLATPHAVMYSDYFHIAGGELAEGSFADFKAPAVKMDADYDCAFVRELAALAAEEGIYAGTLGAKKKALDHGTMVPLYFVNQYYREYQLVSLSLSGLPPLEHYRFGKCVAKVAQASNKTVVFIASGDLSHKLKADGPYGFASEGPQFDKEVTQAMQRGDFLRFLTFEEDFCEAAAECGLRAFVIMAGALDGKAVKPELLSYEGPFGIGYAVAAFSVIGEDKSRQFDRVYEKLQESEAKTRKGTEDEYIKLARQSLEHYVKTAQKLQMPKEIAQPLLQERAGVFVSLKLEGRLRGCIGTIMPTKENVAQEIIQNAVSAGAEDPRFEPVKKEELPRLVYSVDVLGKPEPIRSIKDLDAKRYGVIVSFKGKRGLLLPNLPGVDTPEQQIKIALQKAGIYPDERYSMERFEVIRHESGKEKG